MKWDIYESEFIEEWKSKWKPDSSTESLAYLLDDPYLKRIIYCGLSDGRIRGAISRHEGLKDIYVDLCRSKRKRKPWKKKGESERGESAGGAAGVREPRNPLPPPSDNAAIRKKRKPKSKGRKNKNRVWAPGSHDQGRVTPMTDKLCEACGSQIRWDGNCNCS